MKSKIQWLPVKGFEGVYEVSSDGRVRSLNRKVYLPTLKRYRKRSGVTLKPTTRGGYKLVNLSWDGAYKCKSVHRLVASAFIDNPNNLPEVNHLNGVRHDNRVENLEWCTPSQNIRHSIEVLNKKTPVGADHHNSISVGCFDNTGELLRVFCSIREAGKWANMHENSIGQCVSGRRKSCGGYKWQRMEVVHEVTE